MQAQNTWDAAAGMKKANVGRAPRAGDHSPGGAMGTRATVERGVMQEGGGLLESPLVTGGQDGDARAWGDPCSQSNCPESQPCRREDDHGPAVPGTRSNPSYLQAYGTVRGAGSGKEPNSQASVKKKSQATSRVPLTHPFG